MKEKFRINIRLLMITQLNHWVMAPVVLLLLAIWKNATQIDLPFPLLLWGIMGIVPVYFRLLRRKINALPLSLILHLFALIALPFAILWARSYWVIYPLGVIAYTIYSISYRYAAERADDKLLPAGFSVGMFFLVSVLLLTLKESDKITFLVLLFLPLPIVFFVCYFLTNLNNYMLVSAETTDGIPKKRIIANGMRTVLIFSVLVIIAGVLLGSVASIFLSPDSFLAEAAIGIIRWIVNQIMALLDAIYVPEYLESTERPVINLPFAEEGILPLWVNVLLDCLWKCLILGLFLGIIIFICIKVKNFFRTRKEVHVVEDMEGVEDIHERILIKDKKTVFFDRFRRVSAQEKIRRIYKKTAQGNVQKITGGKNPWYLNYLTPRECMDKIESPQLALLYEKARYSQEECSAQDVRDMKMYEKSIGKS